jgi:hypothetical protein
MALPQSVLPGKRRLFCLLRGGRKPKVHLISLKMIRTENRGLHAGKVGENQLRLASLLNPLAEANEVAEWINHPVVWFPAYGAYSDSPFAKWPG